MDVSSARTYNYLQVIETLIPNGPWRFCNIDVKSYLGIYGNCNNRDNDSDIQADWSGLYLHTDAKHDDFIHAAIVVFGHFLQICTHFFFMQQFFSLFWF